MTLPMSFAVLLLGAVIAAPLRSNRASIRVSIISQTVATALALVAVIPIFFGWPSIEDAWQWPLPIGRIVFRVDALGAFFIAWSLPMTLLGTIYASGYLRPYFAKGRHAGQHFALLNMVSASFVLIYSVQNALVFLLGWEIAAVAAWLLVIWDYGNQKIRFAGLNYLVSTHIGFFVLVSAFMLLHGSTNSMDFLAFGEFLSRQTDLRGPVFLLLCCSFALKSAFFPFHTWLPRAHSAAPAHVSALMSGVIHKAGLFGLLRFTLLMGRPDEWMGWTLLAFGTASAFFGVLYTSTQRDLKRLLGYSSTENVGIAAMGFGVGYLGWTWGNPVLAIGGFTGGVLHILNHALFKCLLFYGAGSVYRATHTIDLERLGGLAKRLPATTALFLLGGLAIAALPPLNGFVSEFIIYAGLLSGQAPEPQGNVALVSAAVVLAFVGAVSAFSITRAFGLTFLGTPRDPHVHIDPKEPRSMIWPMLLHAGGIVAVGLVPEVTVWIVGPTLRLFPFATHLDVMHSMFPMAWPGRILAAALIGASAIAWARGRSARRSVTWGCGYSAVSSRMQYTGRSFSEQFGRVLVAFLPVLRRDRRPDGLFPAQPGALSTHQVDPVERRVFETLGRSDDFFAGVDRRIPDDEPRIVFAVGLGVLILIGILLFQWSVRG